MNEIQEQGTTRRRAGIFADPGRIAPSVHKDWRDDFIVELRLLGVPGDRIGDALVTVESHVVESGQGAREAFGEPRPYARDVAENELADGPAWSVSALTVVGNVVGLVGMLAAVRAFTGWLAGERVAVTVGDLLVLGLVLLLLAAVLRWAPAAVRMLVEHRWAFALGAPVVLIGSFVAALLLFRQTWFEVGVLPVAVLAVVLSAVGAVATWADAPPEGDEILAPGQRPAPTGAARWGTALLLPILTLLLLGLTWVLHALS
ncbi:hypothetical protein [Ornithinimicrobium cerasi]|uniref:Uncharacterized protein n=1 Tax=Ornithinimicrobium cerasi TaxID=2248773 RepID=A0A285VF75_9MICO|nr:hypothetical protein [Ornithinimicrobium cerasi]SOC52719.1 hypothetical protein SAMN05421879_101789 [Ornithinimicrobium cerasi]